MHLHATPMLRIQQSIPFVSCPIFLDGKPLTTYRPLFSLALKHLPICVDQSSIAIWFVLYKKALVDAASICED